MNILARKSGRRGGALAFDDPADGPDEAPDDASSRSRCSETERANALALKRRLDMGAKYRRDRVVYFIATASGSAIKIGVTGDLAKRLITLRAGHHEPLDVVAVLPADWTTERTVHGYFQASRVRGEWFRPTGDILEFIRLLNESRAPAE